jgi:hypothetical protein
MSQSRNRTSVILSVSEESRVSVPCEDEILRLSPQDDIATQSRPTGERGEGVELRASG